MTSFLYLFPFAFFDGKHKRNMIKTCKVSLYKKCDGNLDYLIVSLYRKQCHCCACERNVMETWIILSFPFIGNNAIVVPVKEMLGYTSVSLYRKKHNVAFVA